VNQIDQHIKMDIFFIFYHILKINRYNWRLMTLYTEGLTLKVVIFVSSSSGSIKVWNYAYLC